MALLKLSNFESVIDDSLHALSIQPHNMKAHFQLAQARIALHQEKEALESAKKAYELCMEEVIRGGKGASSLGPITELVHRCRKEEWEAREREKVRNDSTLLGELVRDLEEKRDREILDMTMEDVGMAMISSAKEEWEAKIENLREVFERAGVAKRRKVPDWCIDDITFAVMLDPVVVSFQDTLFSPIA